MFEFEISIKSGAVVGGPKISCHSSRLLEMLLLSTWSVATQFCVNFYLGKKKPAILTLYGHSYANVRSPRMQTTFFSKRFFNLSSPLIILTTHAVIRQLKSILYGGWHTVGA